MRRQYKIVLTESAEQFYKCIARQTKDEVGDGSGHYHAIAVFNSIQQAITQILQYPQDPRKILAGHFSRYYRHCEGRLRVVYSINQANSIIEIVSISLPAINLSRFVRSACATDQLDGLIGFLGINKHVIKLDESTDQPQARGH